MSTSREEFLQRVRQAVAAGNRAGSAAPLPSRGHLGYQGAGSDPIACFQAAFTAAGGQCHIVVNPEEARGRVLDLVRERPSGRILLGRGAYLDRLDLAESLRALGKEVIPVETLPPESCRDPLFAADLGISGVDHLIAETGTVAIQARPGEPRSLSLLPPIHIAVAHEAQIIPDLFDLFEPSRWSNTQGLPSCLSLITGPSKTGDIELRLVTGVHGPGEIHVVLLRSPSPADGQRV